MGRETPSIGLPPASYRKNARSKQAKATLNKTIPALLTAHPRAKKGVQASELIVDPPPPSKESKTAPPNKNSTTKKNKSDTSTTSSTQPNLSISITVSDPLSAAHTLLHDPSNNLPDLTNTHYRVGVLNMASPLTPGGGFLNGSSSAESSLCMRTTLLPSLLDSYYPLPSLGGVYTPDVLVFRDEQAEDLPKHSRWFIDVVSAGMLRFPEVEIDEETGRGTYVSPKDREEVVGKVRGVMRIFAQKGVKRVVVGAWGCGVYGNPVGEVARAWRRVLVGRKGRGGEGWEGVERVVFAVGDRGLAEGFKEAFGEGLEWDEGGGREDGEEGEEDDKEEEEDVEAVRLREMQEKIEEMHLRIEQAKTPQLKAGLTSILAGLESQVSQD